MTASGPRASLTALTQLLLIDERNGSFDLLRSSRIIVIPSAVTVDISHHSEGDDVAAFFRVSIPSLTLLRISSFMHDM
ncbi:MAG: hypothetical protein MZV63_48150 [Marinilabiliales bacterium]|nr:hypothetical protein [Marinilabiliales bacterium]